jgi:hypothetical protein
MRMLLPLFFVLSLQGCVATQFVDAKLSSFSPELELRAPKRAWVSRGGGELYLLATRVRATAPDPSVYGWSIERDHPDQVAVYDLSGRGNVERLIAAKDFAPPDGSRELAFDSRATDRTLVVQVGGATRCLELHASSTCFAAEIARAVTLPLLVAIEVPLSPFELFAVLYFAPRPTREES